MIDISEDVDLAYALSLQAELDQEQENEASRHNSLVSSSSRKNAIPRPVSVVDESWELIDPIPDIRQLFLQFNDAYFKGILGSVEVKWSPRMTLCAGLCCYEGRGGLCSIRLSAPLLKLRPRKDLVQTLLHEMIHALLFVTQNNKDHDGHGPEFLKHMQRINAESGANITRAVSETYTTPACRAGVILVYHNFHDEVNVYRQHWWQCDGPCRRRPPYYGIVRRAMNRAPSPRDTWWADHQRTCGGTYTKIKEPDNYGVKKSGKAKQGKGEKETGVAKNKGHVLGGGNSGTLPRFFKRKTRDSDDSSCNSEYDQEMVKRKKKSLVDDGAVALSDHNEDTKSKLNQPGSSRWTTNVIPFSGPGRTLGSSSDQHDSKTFTKESKKSAFIEIKTPSPNKTKTSSSPTLTIVDAFQRAKDKHRKCNSRGYDLTSPVLGSQQTLSELIADSPGSSTREVKHLHSDHFNSTDTVLCPVCQTLILNCKINQHLDSCLQ